MKRTLAAVLAATLMHAGAAWAQGAPPPIVLFEGGPPRPVTLEALFDAAAGADVVLLGERHDDAAAHRLELMVLRDLARRGRRVVLALEMFERDQQPLLDAYVGGRITERDFLARTDLWPNYAADYRPLVEFARARGWPVVGTNVPRRLAARAAREGPGVLDGLSPAERPLAARTLDCPADAYRAKFVAEMGGGAGHGALDPQRLYESQCLKDETMAETLAGLTRPGVTVVHVNGAFHSDGRMGIVPRLERRRPEARVLAVALSDEGG